MMLDSFTYSDIDLNLCWVYTEEVSGAENHVFSVLASCEQIPTVLLQNADGKFRLQFKKENSVIKLRDNQIWYNKNDITSILKLS